MGLKCSTDIVQAIMESTLAGIENAHVYIDDVDGFSKDWNYYVHLLADILHYFHVKSFAINPLKSEWTIMETDWLGYWLTL